MKSVTTHEAKTHLSRLISEVEEGEEILICRGKEPAAKLVAAKTKSARKRPRVGEVTSEPVTYASDAFDPMGDDELGELGL